MVTFAIAQSSFFASSLVLRETGGMSSFTLEQRQALAFLCIRIAGMIAWLFVGFYGTASIIRGYLIARSSPFLLMPMSLALIPLTFWLLFRGVRVEAIRG